MAREYILKRPRPLVELKIDYGKELNEQQREAVMCPPGPALVIAGAGAGKTRTLIYRVAYLLEQGVPHDRILLLTFTNKAANEMMRRVGELLSSKMHGLWGGTFHAVALRLLRQHAEKLGFQRDFSILDREDANTLIKSAIADSGVDVKARRFPKPDVVGEILSMALNTRKTLREVLQERYSYFELLADSLEQVERNFQKRKRRNNAMDFDDLLREWLRLLENHEDIREYLQRKFQFLLVDEYQDTNRIQGDIIDLLAAKHRNLMVVGDDSQSIYSWRGADFRNILEFPKRYPDSKVYRIEVNYRSTPQILELANHVIRHNVHQFEKTLTPVRGEGLRPSLVPCSDATQQAIFIAQRVLELRDEGIPPARIAVLYRSHFHAMELQLELVRHDIPFFITSGIRFFEQAHIKDVAAYLKLLMNPTDELSFKRIVQLLRGIGTKNAEKLWAAYLASVQSQQPADAETGNPAPTVSPALEAARNTVAKKAVTDWNELISTFHALEGVLREQASNIAELINIIREAGYDDYMQETFTNYRNRQEDLEQFAAYSDQYESLHAFLTEFALATNVETEDMQASPDANDRLRLSTIHQAKGLEFDAVFVIMLCQGLFPSERSLDNQDAFEEERRLFYVAVTRAKTELYLTYPKIRMTRRPDQDFMQIPSTFLQELPEELLETIQLRQGW